MRITRDIFCVILVVLMSCGLAVGGQTGVDTILLEPKTGDTYTIDSRNTSGTSTFTVTPAGVVSVSSNMTVSGTLTATTTRFVHLPINAFVLDDGSSTPLSASTAPGLEDSNYRPAVVFADGETTPIMINFPVPPDYSSGGSFRVFADESDSTTPNQIDFKVYVNTDGTIVDSAASNQTPVALAGTTTTPDLVTLSVATDFASLAAYQDISFYAWRDDTAAGTGDLRIFDVYFIYTASQ